MLKKYIRDKRSPIPKTENVSKVMSANKGRDTAPELELRKALWKVGLTGYRKNYKKLPGKPDIAYPKYKLAIFVNGCFWHRCPHCNYPLPKNNTAFWETKFSKNVARDVKKKQDIESLWWKVLTVWECEIKEDMNKIITLIEGSIK